VITTTQWRTQEIAKGGPFSRPRKVRPFFGKLPSVDLLFGERQLDDLFFLLTDPNATSIVSQSLKGGGHLPVHLFSCLLQAVKNNFPSAKGGPWTPGPPPSVRHCHHPMISSVCKMQGSKYKYVRYSETCKNEFPVDKQGPLSQKL
jgi:hypothetical protein